MRWRLGVYDVLTETAKTKAAWVTQSDESDTF
jgi:hypothetical protein